MSHIYTSADQLIGRTPLLELTHLEKKYGLKARILAGTYPPGGHLDSVRDLAAAAGVNPNTMQRALAQLETEGLVHTERTAGRYVTEDIALIEQLRADTARTLASDFLEKMRGIGYSPAQTAALLEHWDAKEDRNE